MRCMKVLLSGGLGFIFSHVLEYFLKNYDYSILNVDRCSYASRSELILVFEKLAKALNRDYTGWFYENGDVARKDVRQELIAYKPDLIICAHSETHVDNSIKDSAPFIRDNVGGALNLLDVARYTGARFIYISTDEVLAHTPPDVFGSAVKFYRMREEAMFGPGNPYSASKASVEMLVQAYRNTYGIKATIIRPTNVYGYGQNREKLIPKTIANALQDKPIGVYGQGLQWRDYLNINDFVRAFDLIFHEFLSGNMEPVWHVAANQERQNVDTVRAVLRALDKPFSLIEYVDDRLGHDVAYSLDCTKLQSLGWKPRIRWEDGIKEMVRQYQEHV